ncbi:TonB family protein [Rubrivirga litoralis]|uniref:TonB family protein n=1 Tax=Rubrivirga litoralis TaxID=3075598 RepID=A0ABU3BVA8_9BACT|nr:TonB family protein [Rubrivirga sp. F394]MDT0633217.1 TonB family protein [Rubrivirga sp. F394]
MRLPALALLLAAAPAFAQTAPPTAADSALVERYLALSVASAEASRGVLAGAPNPVGDMADLVTSETTLDSVRAAFYADLRPALLADAVAFTEGPLFQRAQRASTLLADSLSFDEIQALIKDPGDRPLADSALSARYAAALLDATQPPDVQERMIDAVIGALPAEVLEPMGGADAFPEMYRSQMQSASMRDLQADAMTRGARLSLAGLSDDDARALVDYMESDAARYAGRATALGTTNALVPRIVDMMASALADVPAPPYAPPDNGARLLDEVAAVQGRLPYPDDVRADGVEGVVVVRFVVGAGGAVEEAEVVSSPDPRLSAVVLDAVRATRFTPVVSGGRPARTPITFPFEFSLDDGRGGADGGR